MAKKQELLELVASLEKSEKKAITEERKKKESIPNYLILYDWIEKEIKNNAKQYDQAKFKQEVAQQWKDRAVDTAETELYKKILEILSVIHTKKSPISELNQYITKAEILKNKGFYDNSLDSLNKAKKIAVSHQRFALLTEIIPKIIDVILLTNHINRKPQIKALSKELEHAIRLVQQEVAYRNLNVNLFVQQQNSRDPKEIDISLKKAYSSIINQEFPTNGSFYSKYYYYSTQAIWSRLHQNGTQAYEDQKEVVQLWKQNKIIQKANIQRYLTQLANLINYATLAKKFEAAQEGIEWMKEVKTDTKDEEVEKNQNLLFYQQYLLLSQYKFKEAQLLFPKIEQLLGVSTPTTATLKGRAKKDYEESQRRIVYYKRVNPSRLYNFYYNTFVILLISQDYSNADKWLKRLRTLYKTLELRKDIQRLLPIFQLIINYGFDGNEFSKQLFLKLKQDVTFEESLLPFERIVYDFFKEMTESKNAYLLTKPKNVLLPKLLKQLDVLDKKNQQALGCEEVIYWIKSYL